MNYIKRTWIQKGVIPMMPMMLRIALGLIIVSRNQSEKAKKKVIKWWLLRSRRVPYISINRTRWDTYLSRSRSFTSNKNQWTNKRFVWL